MALCPATFAGVKDFAERDCAVRRRLMSESEDKPPMMLHSQLENKWEANDCYSDDDNLVLPMRGVKDDCAVRRRFMSGSEDKPPMLENEWEANDCSSDDDNLVVPMKPTIQHAPRLNSRTISHTSAFGDCILLSSVRSNLHVQFSDVAVHIDSK
jgi:hypothetical protein